MSGSHLMRTASRLLSLAGALTVASTGPAHAQSLLAGRGLGVVAEPLDARARGLGGVGLGLPEPTLSLINPASVAGLLAPTLHVTYQPDFLSSVVGDETVRVTTARFPLLHVALPLGQRGVLSAGYGSLLDQNWAVQRDTTLVIGADTVAVLDRFASRGGVATLRLGGAYALNERLAVGVVLDVHTGSVRDSIAREFGIIGVVPARFEGLWTYSGLSYSAGARWNPTEALALGVAATLGGTLRAEPADTLQPTSRYSLPATVAVGASGRVTPTTLLAVSGRWSGWGAADDALTEVGGARDTWSLGGGVEWDAITVGQQVFPVRVGGRFATLPFAWGVDDQQGAAWVDERGLTAGAGVRLAGGAGQVDLALERGARGGEGAGLSESFWRIAVSLTVLGR